MVLYLVLSNKEITTERSYYLSFIFYCTIKNVTFEDFIQIAEKSDIMFAVAVINMITNTF